MSEWKKPQKDMRRALDETRQEQAKNKGGKRKAKTKNPDTLELTVTQEYMQLTADRMLSNYLSAMPSRIFGNAIAGWMPVEETKPPTVDATKLEALKTVEPHKVVKPTPDYVHVLTGWRAWDVKVKEGQWRLEAIGNSQIWEPKKALVATCRAGGALTFGTPDPKHPAPEWGCSCGIWSFKDMDRLVAALGSKYPQVRVLGQVSLWGKVIETENGYRAQYAYPSELWLLDSSLEELGLIYDVPVRTV